MKRVASLVIMCLWGGTAWGQSFFIAQGNGGAGAGNLYTIDGNTCTASLVGAMGLSVTGLAMDPGGTLFATESTSSGSGPGPGGFSRLLTISTTTGAATPVGQLAEGVSAHDTIPDISFIGSTLFGWTESSDQPVTINTATGAVTTLGGGNNSAGSGLAYNGSSLYVIPCASCGISAGPGDEDIYTVNTTTGVVSFVIDLVDNTTSGDLAAGNDTIDSMTFDASGQLWGISGGNAGGPTTPSDLVRINIATGSVTTACTGLPTGIDGIALAASTAVAVPGVNPWLALALAFFLAGMVGLWQYRQGHVNA